MRGKFRVLVSKEPVAHSREKSGELETSDRGGGPKCSQFVHKNHVVLRHGVPHFIKAMLSTPLKQSGMLQVDYVYG